MAELHSLFITIYVIQSNKSRRDAFIIKFIIDNENKLFRIIFNIINEINDS